VLAVVRYYLNNSFMTKTKSRLTRKNVI